MKIKISKFAHFFWSQISQEVKISASTLLYVKGLDYIHIKSIKVSAQNTLTVKMKPLEAEKATPVDGTSTARLRR